MKATVLALTFSLAAGSLCAKEYHVSITGLDRNAGSLSMPFGTISAAAGVAQPGDTITVHEGVYRERVNPPRGGTSEVNRITYRAAPGETVVIKGSEVVKNWTHVTNDTWKATLPNAFFGDFNPFNDLIKGDWFDNHGKAIHTGAVYLNGHWLTEAFELKDVTNPAGETPLWYGQVDDTHTTVWAQFKGVNPNRHVVEVNARRAVFYPEKPGMNYITVRGFTLEHAATPWAPPTAEQIGLIGSHWSRGWIIENNSIRYSVCTGITLGKHGDEFDNTSQDSAEGYVETIHRAVNRGWSRENIGHHTVRNNHISYCGQAGLVGSMGAVFSTVTGNVIHDIHQDRAFWGAEMAGIKFHAPIDSYIGGNHIYRCGGHGGIWLDWMTQGTRVTGNLLHDNSQDLFVEVNHGPFLVDNNLFLSPGGMLEACGGGAYVHNLFGCQIRLREERNRETPFHKPHSTAVLGLSKVVGDDERFHNNLFVGHGGLSVYDQWEPAHLQAVGNVYLAGAKPSGRDREAWVATDVEPGIRLQETSDGWWFEMSRVPTGAAKQGQRLVTTESLGRAQVSGAAYVQPDGTSYRLDTDYFGKQRNTETPAPGPFQFPNDERIRLRVWPRSDSHRATAKPLQVYILAGQSNMQGHAKVTTFDHLAMDPQTVPLLREMRAADGTPRVCDSVWISALGIDENEHHGKLTAGYGAKARGPKIGPEFTFGITMQSSVDAPILIIKTAWGGKSLNTDFRSPSAGPYEFNQRQLEQQRERGQDIEKLKAERAEATGRYYRLMIDHVRSVLKDPRPVYPQYDPTLGYELAGFVWFQGWNDMVDGSTYPDRGKQGSYAIYTECLTDFIRDVRKDLSAPEMHFVIGVMGTGGPLDSYAPDQARYKGIHGEFRKAMAAPAAMSEFKGNVTAVLTEKCWDIELGELAARWGKVRAKSRALGKDESLSPEERSKLLEEFKAELYTPREMELYEKGISNAAYHYLGSAKIMARIGKAFAEALIDARRETAEQPAPGM